MCDAVVSRGAGRLCQSALEAWGREQLLPCAGIRCAVVSLARVACVACLLVLAERSCSALDCEQAGRVSATRTARATARCECFLLFFSNP